MDLGSIGRMLIVAGLLIAGLGILLALGDRIPFLGRLPGDVQLRGDGWAIYIPIATSILLSVILTAVLSFVVWLRR